MHKCARARGIFRSVKADAPNLGTTRTGGWAGRWRRRETCDSIDVYCHRSGFGWICARTQQMAVLKRRWRSGRTYSKAPLRIIYVLQLNSNEFVLLFEQHVCCVGEYVSFSPIVCVCVYFCWPTTRAPAHNCCVPQCGLALRTNANRNNAQIQTRATWAPELKQKTCMWI